jgi:hypothetical protein
MLGGTAFHFTRNAPEAEHQQMIQVPSGAVCAKIPQIMDMQVTRQMRVAYFIGIHLV